MRHILAFTAIALIASPVLAEEQKYEFSNNPASARMMALCEKYAQEEIKNSGNQADEAKLNAATERLAASDKFMAENLTPTEQNQVSQAVKVFDSYYKRDMDMLKSKDRPYTASTVYQICMKHAAGAGKKFDTAWQAKKEAEEKAAQIAKDKGIEVATTPAVAVEPHTAKLPTGTPAISDEARTKLLDSLNKTLATIDQSLANKFTSDEEKAKLTEQRKSIEAEVTRWQKKS